MATPYQSSKVSRRARNVPLEWGEWWGGIISSTTTRITEKDGIDRLAHGEQIAATNNAAALATSRNESLKCSTGHFAHYLEFAECKQYPWRHGGRQYYCRECMKKKRLQGGETWEIDPADEKRLRSKPNKRRKHNREAVAV